MNTRFVGTKLFILAVLIFQSAASAWAQVKKPVSLAELAAYNGRDREQRLLAGARAEGKVVWYTSLAGASYKELAKGFEAKYPGIKVEAYRATSSDIMTRITAEAQAKQILADVLETTVPPLTYLRENKLLVPYTSPFIDKYPASTKEDAGRGLIYWAVDRETYSGVGYNTKLIPASAVPKNYSDLLKPELKGKIGFVSNETGARALGGMLKVKGEEFLKKLKMQDIRLQAVSGRAMADLVVSGEVPLSPTVFRDHAIEVKSKGAPVEWVPMDVVPTNTGGVAIIAQSRNYHAAILMADFLLSPEGAKILGDLEYGSPLKQTNYKLWYPEAGMSMAQYGKALERWHKLLRELGRK
ncbi:MAG: ABC transporter substrate-binding protein [Candidatus Binatia bacterium]